ncbi:Sas10/Utp3/C1D family-domain-containing protein [Cryomyces antarcticus]|uniref:Exosome complex protein n=1 Tax=Cryomyces antarcticus TaxID=329879 RepID=A0ABR0KT72_9PEZI|nr:hypothetical protein LTR39_001751 [Cryomyces antarcticus]KAK5017999.1 hypothetical protein LTR60_001689 [Cryomyces antarcticus]KAK5128603.1 hypothetical protein LTR16_002556 [Cryomyces antarcticus]
MEAADLLPMLEDLSGNIDDLEDSLAPLLKQALSATTSTLPLLDKAKLYVLTTYAIDSILFNYLRLNGADAKKHPVFTEITRVKQYFEKIKLAETAGVKRDVTLNKGAAGRFIKHGLAGNEKWDRERVAQQAREKDGAQRKLGALDQQSEQRGKKRKSDGMDGLVQDSNPTSRTGSAGDSDDDSGPSGSQAGVGKSKPNKRSKKRRKQTEGSGLESVAACSKLSSSAEEIILPSKASQAPRGPNAAFQALLNAPSPKADDKEQAKKGKKAEKRQKKAEEAAQRVT